MVITSLLPRGFPRKLPLVLFPSFVLRKLLEMATK